MATTTKTFVGFNDEARNSSKVLRPPGGGSSDIFGLKDPVQVEKKVEESQTLEGEKVG